MGAFWSVATFNLLQGKLCVVNLVQPSHQNV